MKLCEGVEAIGAGFDNSYCELDEEALRNSGILYLLTRDGGDGEWNLREFGPFIGHYA